MDSFASSVQIFVDSAKDKQDKVVRATALKILARLIQRSPVGNPKLWQVNQTAAAYNAEVVKENQRRRMDKNNLAKTKSGRIQLKPGRKLHDGMDIKAPPGYTGGRFRGNWQVTFTTAAQGETGRVDKSGAETLAAGSSMIETFKVGMVDTIYFTNNVPYAIPLEFGHSTQAPQGMVRITAREFLPIVNQATRESK